MDIFSRLSDGKFFLLTKIFRRSARRFDMQVSNYELLIDKMPSDIHNL